MTTIIICTIIIIIILRIISKNKCASQSKISTGKTSPVNDNLSYWEGFKRRKPDMAGHVEIISNRDMSRLDNVSASQIVKSVIRWSENAGVPVGELKNNCLKEVKDLLSQTGMSYDMLIDKLKKEKYEEARTFGISPDYTVCSFMLEILERDRQDEIGKKLTQNVGKKFDMTQEEIDTLAVSVNKTAEKLNIAPDISNLDRVENRLFNLAEEGARMLNNLTVGISDQIYLTTTGFAEARILCSTIVIELTPDFKNEIDLDKQADRYFMLLADATLFDCCYHDDDVIGFINSRIAFYNKKLRDAGKLNALQVLQPDNALAKIFNTLYLHPETDNPDDLIPGEIKPNDLIMFRGQLEKVVKYLRTKSRQISRGASVNESDKLQRDIEQALMLLFPESKRAMVNKDMVLVLTEVILRDLKNGDTGSQTFAVLPPEIKSRFVSLASKIKNYSLNNSDLDDIIECAQNNVANKFD